MSARTGEYRVLPQAAARSRSSSTMSKSDARAQDSRSAARHGPIRAMTGSLEQYKNIVKQDSAARRDWPFLETSIFRVVPVQSQGYPGKSTFPNLSSP
jgi:hypothetical protein